ncbi:MAG: Ig-like domain-containing protein [Chloroflexota bacterium]|nr:Ig-like domain-containing protein [Chloroflexota bacterium]
MFSPIPRRFVAFFGIAIGGCGESSAPGVVTREATILAAVSPTSITTTVGSDVVDPPSVIVQDMNGNPTPGVVVTFAVTDGKGWVSGPIATSNSAGIARVGRWKLGYVVGTNAVTANAGTLTPVMFRATAVAGPPARINKFSGDNQIAAPGTTVALSPQVRVTDHFGNPISGIDVNFAVGDGGGSLAITGAVSDTAGIAAAGVWTLGSPGSQSIVARATSLPAAIFTAIAIQPPYPCAGTFGLAEGTMLRSQLSAQSCAGADGGVFEAFTARPTSDEAYTFNLMSTDFDTYLELRGPNGTPIASNDNVSPSTKNSMVKAFLRPGTVTLMATSTGAVASGFYSISYGKASSDVTGCEPVFIVRGVTTTPQNMSSSDCVVSTYRSEDRYRIWLKAGALIDIQVEDWSYPGRAAFDIADSTGKLIETSRALGGNLYGTSFTALADGYYLIAVFGTLDQDIAYVLSVK